jgi:fructosamine-3-kinase
MPVHRKSASRAPTGYFAWEAAGLRWLAAAPEGVPVVEVLDVGSDHLDLRRLTQVVPTAAAAAELGTRLARTHLSGATAYGSPPPGWTGGGYFGPLHDPLPLRLEPHPTWGRFWAAERLTPITRVCRDRGTFSVTEGAMLDRVAERCAQGLWDTGDPPARVHGDLWSGNVMWTTEGATLIDPSAHGGHREYDLAMLALFGAPYLEATLAAYHAQWPLTEGWRERVGLHQLHALAVHALLFGGGYAAQTLAVARRYR